MMVISRLLVKNWKDPCRKTIYDRYKRTGHFKKTEREQWILCLYPLMNNQSEHMHEVVDL